MARADYDFNTVKPTFRPCVPLRRTAPALTDLGIWRQRNMPRKIPTGYYVYTISVDDVVRYIGKGKGLRLYSHMKEVRHRLNRDFKLRSIGSRFQQNLTRAVISGAKVVEQVLVEELTEKAAYKLEYEKLREYVYAGKRDQLWNVIPASIQTPSEQQAFMESYARKLVTA
jgi:hypothetical protein